MEVNHKLWIIMVTIVGMDYCIIMNPHNYHYMNHMHYMIIMEVADGFDHRKATTRLYT